MVGTRLWCKKSQHDADDVFLIFRAQSLVRRLDVHPHAVFGTDSRFAMTPAKVRMLHLPEGPLSCCEARRSSQEQQKHCLAKHMKRIVVLLDQLEPLAVCSGGRQGREPFTKSSLGMTMF